MAILLPVLVAAFCVLLTVRIANRRERWAKRTLAAIIGLPVLYVASFGPACWFASRANPPHAVFDPIYMPLCKAAVEIKGPVWDFLVCYGGIGMPDGAFLLLPTDQKGERPTYFAGIQK